MLDAPKSSFDKFQYKKLQLPLGKICRHHSGENWRKARPPTNLGKIGKAFFFLKQLTKARILSSNLYLQNALLIFMIFKNEYGKTLKVDMYKYLTQAGWAHCGLQAQQQI